MKKFQNIINLNMARPLIKDVSKNFEKYLDPFLSLLFLPTNRGKKINLSVLFVFVT